MYAIAIRVDWDHAGLSTYKIFKRSKCCLLGAVRKSSASSQRSERCDRRRCSQTGEAIRLLCYRNSVSSLRLNGASVTVYRSGSIDAIALRYRSHLSALRLKGASGSTRTHLSQQEAERVNRRECTCRNSSAEIAVGSLSGNGVDRSSVPVRKLRLLCHFSSRVLKEAINCCIGTSPNTKGKRST